MSTRRVSYCLIVCATVLYSTSVTASFYADYSRRPLSEMLEAYSRFEANLQAGSNYNVGAAAALMVSIGKKGDRAALPFLEKKSLMETIPRVVRRRAAEVYVSLATAGECAVFLPKILQIDDEDKRIISWRSRVLPACLKKIEASIAKNELPAETLAVLTGKLLMFTQSQSVYNTGDCDSIDQFLVRHCADYSTSGQRFAMWTNHLGQISQIPWKGETIKKYTPLKESLESLPANRRVDLRKQFPDLPPLPEEKVSGVPWKTALGTVAGAAALAAAGAWLAARRRKWHETE